MTLKSFSFAAAAAFALTMPASTWAHHSHANYRQAEFIVMEGTVTTVSWMNPHVWLYMEVIDTEGQPNVWALEGGGIRALTGGGWTRDTIKVGDKISVRCHHLKDGSNGCLLGYVTTSDGVEKEFD